MQEANWELILHRLDDLTKNQVELNKKLDNINSYLSKINTVEINVEEISTWKKRMQDNISVTELKEIKDWKVKYEELISPKNFENMMKEHENLKTFKTQATMIWVVVQVIMTLAVFWQKFFG